MRTGWLRHNALDVAVALLAVGFAGYLFAGYYAEPDSLWQDAYHDRNSHFAYGLDIALKVRSLDVIGFFEEIERAKIWPPFHGLVLAAVLLIGGIDHRLAVVPSLAGWAMTVVFAWLIGRQLFRDRLSGLIAGAVAVAFIVASPAFRLISTDAMLEGLGSGLTAMAIWAFVRAYDAPADYGRWRVLAITLTVLFFHKGNYWGLAVLSLAVTALLLAPGPVWQIVRDGLPRFAGRLPGLLVHGLKDPLIVLAFLVLIAVGVLAVSAPIRFHAFGRDVTIGWSNNLLTVGYALAYLRFCLAWYPRRAAADRRLGVPGQAVFYWHFVPVAVSFLLPQRLGVFLHFVGPLNNPGDSTLLEALRLYGDAFLAGFSPAPWLGWLTLALFAVALIMYRRLVPAGRVVLVFAILATIALLAHPQHQARFLTTSLFALWLGAGAGAAVLGSAVSRLLGEGARQLAATAAIAVLVVAMVLARPDVEAASAAAIHPTKGESDLELVRAYAPFAEGASKVAIAATFGDSRLIDWPLEEMCRCALAVDRLRITPDTRETARRLAEAWLAQVDARRLIVIDLPRSPWVLPVLGWTYDRMGGIMDALAGQDRFAVAATREVPRFGGRIVVLDRRDEPPAVQN